MGKSEACNWVKNSEAQSGVIDNVNTNKKESDSSNNMKNISSSPVRNTPPSMSWSDFQELTKMNLS